MTVVFDGLRQLGAGVVECLRAFRRSLSSRNPELILADGYRELAREHAS